MLGKVAFVPEKELYRRWKGLPPSYSISGKESIVRLYFWIFRFTV
jgi:hypothetical protein